MVGLFLINDFVIESLYFWGIFRQSFDKYSLYDVK